MTPTQLDIRVSEADGRTIVHVSGEVDIATAPRMEQEIQRVSGVSEAVTVDLGGLTFIDSTGLAVLLRARRAAEDGGAPFGLANVPAVAHRLFELTGVQDYLEGDAG